MRLKTTLSTLATVTAVSAAGLLGLSATPAAAAGVDFEYGRNSQAAEIDAWKDNRMRASQTWQIDPLGDGSKGDTLCVKDHWKEGWYVVATTSKGHRASTKGHTAGYTKCVTKNVAEGKKFTMRMTLVGSNGGTIKSANYTIHG
ncbi:hypothetical protein ACFWY6_26255 [Streptomyces sp. NPDC059037]|uniref:hypothetical protein n=1 Tax=Streptomyces sp. NPDC059037 TaxID=3346710 RepID=UPI0036BFCEE2